MKPFFPFLQIAYTYQSAESEEKLIDAESKRVKT